MCLIGLLDKAGAIGNDPLFELALKLERNRPQRRIFCVRASSYPNVRLLLGYHLQAALGIPRSMFTVLFAIAAHRRLGRANWQGNGPPIPHMRIGRRPPSAIRGTPDTARTTN